MEQAKELCMVPDEKKMAIARFLDDTGLLPDRWTTAAFLGTDEDRRNALELFLKEHEFDEDRIVELRANLLLVAELVKLNIEDLDAIRSAGR